MFSAVASHGFSILRDRWKPLLGAFALMLLSLVLLLAPFWVTVGGVSGLVDAGRNRAAGSSPNAMNPAIATQPPAVGSAIGTQGSPAAQPELPGSSRFEYVPTRTIVMVMVAVLLTAITGLAFQLGGVAIALGSSVFAGFRAGLLGLPFLFTQCLIAGWRQWAVIAVGGLLTFLVPTLGILISVGGYMWLLLSIGRFYVIFGCVAAGDRTWHPTRALQLLNGSYALTGALAIIAVACAISIPAAVPIVGIAASALSAMWGWAGIAALYREVGGPALNPDGSELTPRRLVTMTDEPSAVPVHTSGAPAAVAPVTPIALPAAVAAPRPQAQQVAGPGFDGTLEPAGSWGEWIQLATPGRVAVQLTWSGQFPPVVHALDQGGTARSASQNAQVQGQPVWLELPAGQSYLCVQVQDATAQQLCVRTWVPSAPAAVPVPRTA